MGIKGLLPALRDAMKVTTLQAFAGKRAAVDASIWLHRGCISCAKELAKGQKSTKYISYFMKQVQELINARINPVIVFDGGELPLKKGTNEKRKLGRDENIRMAEEYEARGMETEALNCYIKSVSITPQLLVPLFQRLRRSNVEFIVAPYEADAQLAYLAHNHIVDFVITEDSDILLYKCPLTIFKNKKGNCEALAYNDIFKIKEFSGFTHQMFVEMCVFSGCDYLDSIPKMGIRTAQKLISKYRTAESVIRLLNAEPDKWEVPENYKNDFDKACIIFEEHLVYDPKKKMTVGIFKESTHEYAGPPLSKSEAVSIANGKMNPRTKELYEPEEVESGPIDRSLSVGIIPKNSPSANLPFKSPSQQNSPSTFIYKSQKAKSTSSFIRFAPDSKISLTPQPKQFVPPSLRGFSPFSNV